jgi:hypothetical protein
MKNTLSQLLTLIILSSSLSSCAQLPSSEWQIKTALLACPDEFRANATVLGYDNSGAVVELRKGTNSMIALADNPETDSFSSSSYHIDLEPFMSRGRALKLEGKDFKEIFDIREAEAKSGSLEMPERSTLYVITGDVNPETKEIENTYLRYVIYIPFATAASSGLPSKPISPDAPWTMDPGTHRAHIMITPERK